MNVRLYKCVLDALAVCGLASAVAATVATTSGAETPWKVEGELEEACSCLGPCHCWFKERPTRMTCDGVQMICIKKGHFGKTPLDGLALAQFVQSPEGKSMYESFGNWNFDNVYIDEKANEEQRRALKEISAHLFPPAAKTREFRFAPISRRIEGRDHIITVGDYGHFTGRLMEGGYAGPPKILNPPLADPTHLEFLQGEAASLTYNDAGQGWKYENSNYMFNKFKVDHKQYQKFEAEMARKMAQAGAKAD